MLDLQTNRVNVVTMMESTVFGFACDIFYRLGFAGRYEIKLFLSHYRRERKGYNYEIDTGIG